MLALVIGVIALLLVFAVAAAVVGRETHRLVEEAPRPVFDLDEAVEWVAAALPVEVASQLSHDDVRRLLSWSLEHLAASATTTNGEGPSPAGPSIVATGEVVDAITARAVAEGLDCNATEVHAVLDAELGYLQAIGAMGPPEPPAGSGGGDRS